MLKLSELMDQKEMEELDDISFDGISFESFDQNIIDEKIWDFEPEAKRTKEEAKVEQRQQQSHRKIDLQSQQQIEMVSGKKLSSDQKEAIQKTLAEKFITKGYGYIINMKSIKKRHKVIINASFYNNTMSSIVRRAFRALETFLLKNCKQKNIARLSHYQGSLLRSPMLQCIKWMKKEQLDTFYKFICRSYNLKKVTITSDQACRLYGQIIQSAKDGHQVSHIILHRAKKKSDAKNSQGLTFSYAPTSIIAKTVSNSEGIELSNKFILE